MNEHWSDDAHNHGWDFCSVIVAAIILAGTVAAAIALAEWMHPQELL